MAKIGKKSLVESPQSGVGKSEVRGLGAERERVGKSGVRKSEVRGFRAERERVGSWKA